MIVTITHKKQATTNFASLHDSYVVAIYFSSLTLAPSTKIGNIKYVITDIQFFTMGKLSISHCEKRKIQFSRERNGYTKLKLQYKHQTRFQTLL